MLRAQIAFTSNRGSDAPPLLLDAARRLEPLDVTLARETYLEALMAAQFAGRCRRPAPRWRSREAARAAPPAPAPRAADLLLDGLAVMITDGHAAAAPLLQRAVDAFRDGDVAAKAASAGSGSPSRPRELWDHEAWHELAARSSSSSARRAR